ncbi:hypothetical protein [Methylobacter sp.]|uniref:hypothetical protein n=1 Tax=Methylobacter sp. TaxID=2051955 RepID=UPI002FDCB144
MKKNCGVPSVMSPLSYSSNKPIFFYLVIPLLFGILLGDWLGIDISTPAAQHIGLLRFIQKAGIDIHTKSMIFVLYLIFSPYALYYFFNCRKTIVLNSDPLKVASTSRLLILTLGTLLMILVFYALVFIGPHESYIAKPDRKIRSLIALSQWDISFAVFVGGMIFAGMASLYAPFMFINELLLRLKKRMSRIGLSK